MGETYSFQNITDANGYAIALTGMLIVFSSLVLVSIFIAVLPRILPRTGEVGQAETVPQPAVEGADDMAVAAALGYAFYLRQKRPDQPS